MLPESHDADAFRNWRSTPSTFPTARAGRYSGKYFRIGHLGDINDGYLMGALATTEMALALAGVPHKRAACRRRSIISSRRMPARRRRRRSSACSIETGNRSRQVRPQ